jgi:redox-sensitive bicupin YhaK (pirin superfamily)
MTAPTDRKRLRSVRPAPPAHWVGDGFPVRTLFSYQADAAAADPFLLLDYAAPADFPPADRPRGVGEHPHRGFETVTVVYQGHLEHRDSAGHHGTIGPGDVQWMTAGAGVVHEEWHEQVFTRRGGTLEMVQLWVNLPAAHKLTPPRYQEIRSDHVPTVRLGGGGFGRVIAGTCQDATGPARTVSPVGLLDVRLLPGGRVEVPVPDGHTTLAVVLHGRVTVDDSAAVGEAELAVFDLAGGHITLASEAPAHLLVLSGQPLGEPVVGHGPFVMNTEAEIRQAVADYRGGRIGRAPA